MECKVWGMASYEAHSYLNEGLASDSKARANLHFVKERLMFRN